MACYRSINLPSVSESRKATPRFCASVAHRGGGVLFGEIMQDTICGVYRLIHKESGRCYIGSAFDVSARVRAHLKGKGGAPCLCRAIKAHGADSFLWELVERCSRSNRLQREEHHIAAFNSVFPNGFNLNPTPTARGNYECSEATRRWMSESRKGTLIGNKLGLGCKHSVESRLRRSASLQGHPVSDATRRALAEKATRNHATGRYKASSKQHSQRMKALWESGVYKKHSDAIAARWKEGCYSESTCGRPRSQSTGRFTKNNTQ